MNRQPVGSRQIGSRTVVITGGNSGLGFGCANAILKSLDGPSWHVILACRDEGRAQAAVDQLISGAGVAGQVEAMSLDLASLASVRAFAAELTKRLSTGTIPPLHAVVCNAGVNPLNTKTVTADGFESTFGINHLGHFLLVNELLPVLQSPARVVVVASGVHDPAQKSGVPAPAWNSPAALAHGELGPAAASDKAFASGQRRYSTSKLANVYFTYALARRLPAGITANAFDPGLMPGTGLMREAPAAFRFILGHIPIALDHGPNNFEVYAEVVVNDFVPHSSDLLPRDLRLLRFRGVGEVFHRLTDHLEFAKRGVLTHPIGKELRASAAGVCRDVVERVADMFEVDPIVFHSDAASARIRR